MSKVTTTFEAVDTGMVATINKIERETKSMSNATEKAETQFKTSFSAMAAAGAGLVVGIGAIKGAFAALTGTIDNFGQALDMGGRLSDLSARTGETAGNLLLLERAFDNSGVGADKVGTSINKLQKFMSDANNGAIKNIEVLENLGLSYTQLEKLSPADQLAMIAEKISAINSPTERAAAAMGIFGRAGGELLPFLQNFSGEMSNAKDELGSMAGIMDKKSEVFDTISDKIAVIKGKFTEFAVGLLSNVTPALELFTTLLAKIDVAGIGERLTKGGMKFFDVLVGAFRNGAEAASMIGTSLMYSIKSFGNSLLNNITDTASFITPLFVAGFKTVANNFEGFIVTSSYKMLSIITEGFIKSAAILGGDVEHVAKGMGESLQGQFAVAGKLYGMQIEKENIKIQDDLAETMAKTRESTKDFFGAQGELDKLRETTKKLGEDGKKFRDGIIGDEKSEVNPLAKMEESGKKIELSMRKTGEDLKGIKKEVGEISMIQKLMNDLTEAKINKQKGIEPLKGDLKQQIEQGNFKQAERTIERIQRKEQEAAIRIDKEGNRDSRNIADIAKTEGIDTFGKSQSQIRKEILEKRKGGDLLGDVRRKENEVGGKEKPAEKVDPLLEVVKMIKDLVAKIEPKLPQRALV